MTFIKKTIKNIEPLCNEHIEKSKLRFSNIAIPLGGLGIFQDIIIKLCGIQKSVFPDISKRAVLVFCADNGIVSQGVTQCGQEVTAIVTENIGVGKASVCIMAKQNNVDVIPVDVGVSTNITGQNIRKSKIRFGTKDMTLEPAMTREDAINAIKVGINLAHECKQNGYKILCVGEMGIGNTTTTSAITSSLLNIEPEKVTGKGAGLSDDGLKLKISAIKKAILVNKPDNNDIIDVLHKIGGLDICSIVGVYLGAAECRIPVISDGVITCVAALCAKHFYNNITDYIIMSHLSNEPASNVILNALNMRPFIDAKMHLGEGTGAVMSIPLIDASLSTYKNMITFKDTNIESYKPL